jgi:hypothetical protein
MALLNYSTTIASAKTASEIQNILAKHGANAIMINYEDGEVIALSFQIDTPHGNLAIKLPINWQSVLRVEVN